jgi:DNA segregation ATPase FtsK/SpoIIIE, S-DNA-T family
LLTRAAELVITRQSGSAAAIQKELRVGYIHATGLLDHLEALGVVGPAHGTKARTVLVSPDMLSEVTTRIAQQAETLT